MKDEAWLEQDLDLVRVLLHLINQGEGGGYGLRVSQTHQAYVVAPLGKARVFSMPN